MLTSALGVLFKHFKWTLFLMKNYVLNALEIAIVDFLK